MKTSGNSRHGGFTLIELLVVIGIIALLAGIAVPTAGVVMDKARRSRAKTLIKGLEIAVKSYQTEYNRLPNPSNANTDNDPPMDTDSGNTVLKALLVTDKTYNPREIKFFDPPSAKNGLNGLTSTGDLTDPWLDVTNKTGMGQFYHMVLDYDGDGTIKNPVKNDAKFDSTFTAQEPDTLSASVIIFSDGDGNQKHRKPVTSWGS